MNFLQILLNYMYLNYVCLNLQLVTISEYHLKQIHDNMPSFCSDTEGSFTSSEGGHSFSIGMIYQSKVNILVIIKWTVQRFDKMW